MSDNPDLQQWAVIDEFPDYEVSDFGLIFSVRRKIVMKTTQNNYGNLKINLINSYGRQTRSVAPLVARAFVVPPDHSSVSVILLDGNKRNVAADNLEWRPHSFAWEYARQLRTPQPRHILNLKVTNVLTGEEYSNIESAGMAEGLLFKDIWRSTHQGSECYPTRAIFEVTENRVW